MSEPSFHDRMMNVPHPENTVYKKGECEVRLRLSYSTGHKDARHACAEIACEADQRIADLHARYIAAEQSATVALQAQTIFRQADEIAELQRENDSMENQLDRLEEAATALTPYPEGYRPTAWEAVFELPGELRKARERATLIPQLVAALKAARGFIASTHSVTGIEKQIDAAIAAGEGR